MNNMIWFLFMFFFIILEIGHPGLLYFLALAGGSAAAYVASLLGSSLSIQYLVFFVTSILAIFLVYRFVRCISIQNKGSYRSNTDLLLGKTAIIVSLQSLTSGQGKLGGEIWFVKYQGEGALQIGMKVSVVGVQGCHLQVR